MLSDEERKWLYGEPPVTGAVQQHRGPVSSSLLLRLLERGIGVSPHTTLVWCEGMPSWQLISSTEPFVQSSRFLMTQWYYLVQEGDSSAPLQQKGPVLSRLLLHKLSAGDIDGLTLVISNNMSEWSKVCEVPELKEAMQRVAEEEEKAEQRATAALQSSGHDSSDLVFDLNGSFPPASEAGSQVSEATAAPPNHPASKAGDGKKASKSAVVPSKPPKPQHNWVYITGLPSDCTEQELLAHFSRVGLVALHPATQQPKLRLYRDAEGKPKGDASLCYIAPQSADMAVDVLSGGFLRVGCMVTVTRASFQQPAAEADGGNNKGKKVALAPSGEARSSGGGAPRVSAAQLKTAYAATQQALSWAEDDDGGVKGAVALKIVVVEGWFDPASFSLGPTFEQRLEANIANECEAFGDIEKITVFSKHPAGITIVKFATSYAAQHCVASLNGRAVTVEVPPAISKGPGQAQLTPAQRVLKAYYWDGSTNYDAVGSGKRAREEEQDEAERDEQQRLEDFGAWIEEQELPAEFALRTE